MKKLEIQGFKSFADRLVLEFDEGITGIVGPNGSGKSNVADAIRWVLGEQSVKTLRGAKMEDVIFAGTDSRKPVSYAQVAITFDNRENLFPIDYSEVCITRRVYRSGESEYYINKSRCRLKDIHEMLMDTGIGKDGYSIIGQGQIERIISTKPDDRRNIFEEAAGIVKYKSRKESAEKKLEEEKQNLIRINDIISEIEKQLEPLENQAKKTKQYIELSNRLKNYEMNQFINEHESIKGKLFDMEKDITLILQQIESSKSEQSKAKEENSEYFTKLNNIEQAIEETRNRITNLKTEREKLDGQLQLSNEKINHLRLENKRLEDAITDSESKMDEKKDLREEREDKLRVIEKSLQMYREQLKDSENNIALAENEMSSILEKLDENKREVSTLYDHVTEKKTLLQRNEILVEQLEDGLTQKQNEVDKFKSNLLEHERVKTELSNKASLFHKTLEEYSIKLENYQQVSDEKKEMLSKLNDDYQKEINNLNMRRSRLKFLEDLDNDYEGFNKSVRNILRLRDDSPSKWNRIHGVVADLIEVPKKLELAIEVALGANIQNMVVEDEACAKDAIEYLKNNKLGRATFLPLNRIQERKVSYNKTTISSCPGFVGFANELIQYNKRYSQVMSRLLGNIIIAEDFHSATLISNQYGQYFRIVTLEGEQFNIGGSITGGSYYKKNSSILSRKREVVELKEKISKYQKNILQKQDKLDRLKEEITYNEGQYNTFMTNYNTCQQQLNEVKQKLEQVDYLRNYVMDKINQVSEEIKISEEQIHDKQQIIISCKEEIHEINEKKNFFDKNYQDMEESIQNKRAHKESLNAQLTDIKIKYNELKQNKENINQNLNWVNRDIEELKQTIETSLDQIKANEESIQKIILLIEEDKENIEMKNQYLLECDEKLEELDKGKLAVLTKRKDIEEKIEASLEKVNVLSNELNRYENQKTRLEVQLDNLRDRIWEEYQLTYSTCLKYKQDLGTEKEIKDTINELRSTIKSLGSINMNAIEEHEAICDRYEFLTSQKEDIINAEEKLLQLINELTKAMEEQFEERFKIIAHEFNLVFQQLFGGGKGILKLSNHDDPLNSGIEIIASPPGKKLQSMTLMSGGEKALTAIALLFAIQKRNPSPFCVLDEIEAALDDSNIKRFADYLIQLTNQTQFLIITHRKGTMEVANALYGITMQEKGISKSVSVKFDESVDEVQYA